VSRTGLRPTQKESCVITEDDSVTHIYTKERIAIRDVVVTAPAFYSGNPVFEYRLENYHFVSAFRPG
jgi:hypothetical protein